jgi:hypothetical protein
MISRSRRKHRITAANRLAIRAAINGKRIAALFLSAALAVTPLAASFAQDDAPAMLPKSSKGKAVSRRLSSSENDTAGNELSFGEVKRTSGESTPGDNSAGKKSAVRTADVKAEDGEPLGRVVRALASDEPSGSTPKRKAIKRVAAEDGDIQPAQWTASRTKSVLVNNPEQERIPSAPEPPARSAQEPQMELGGRRQLRADCGNERQACEEARKKVFANTIDRIQIDLSPLLFSDKTYSSIDAYIAASEEITRQGLKDSPFRSWVDRNGAVIVENARLLRVRSNTVVVVDAAGVEKVIPISQLSETEMCEVADTWGIPVRCRLKEELYNGRMFCATTFTWTASALCHKPNYFEQIELERYGHTPGPILEAPMAGVKFAADIATLPYKMGINPPNECKYALGYYRPGNCAPWIIPPVPLSLRGAIFQATAATGISWIIP